LLDVVWAACAVSCPLVCIAVAPLVWWRYDPVLPASRVRALVASLAACGVLSVALLLVTVSA
jgi:hypothetical protein